MNAKLKIEKVTNAFRERKGHLCCNEVKGLLEQLGFNVRDGKRGGHKIFTHIGLSSFTSGGYNCGHGKNPEVKPAYITKLVRILEEYKTDLTVFLEGEK